MLPHTCASMRKYVIIDFSLIVITISPLFYFLVGGQQIRRTRNGSTRNGRTRHESTRKKISWHEKKSESKKGEIGEIGETSAGAWKCMCFTMVLPRTCF